MEPRAFQERGGVFQGNDESGQHNRDDLHDRCLDNDYGKKGRAVRRPIMDNAVRWERFAGRCVRGS